MKIKLSVTFNESFDRKDFCWLFFFFGGAKNPYFIKSTANGVENQIETFKKKKKEKKV